MLAPSSDISLWELENYIHTLLAIIILTWLCTYLLMPLLGQHIMHI